jgi:hypothetical protein
VGLMPPIFKMCPKIFEMFFEKLGLMVQISKCAKKI